jgi:hypothetical protein
MVQGVCPFTLRGKRSRVNGSLHKRSVIMIKLPATKVAVSLEDRYRTATHALRLMAGHWIGPMPQRSSSEYSGPNGSERFAGDMERWKSADTARDVLDSLGEPVAADTMPQPKGFACPECDGWGMTEIAVCTSPHDEVHRGIRCGGQVCGGVEVECDVCQGTGERPCDDCGERPATVGSHWVHRETGRKIPLFLCHGCVEEEVAC